MHNVQMTAIPHNQGLCIPNCFGCKVASVAFAGSAMPTRSEAGTVERETRKMHSDVAAYRRLRKNGLQPKSVKGAALLEKTSDSKWEIETGQRIGDLKITKRLEETQAAINKGEAVI